MTHLKQRALPLLLALCLTLSLTVQASAANTNAVRNDTARTVLTTVQSPQLVSELLRRRGGPCKSLPGRAP